MSGRGVFKPDDSEALHRIYGAAKAAVDARIVINGELERRLAIIVLFTYGAELNWQRVGNEDAIAKICAARLIAQTSTA